uniref:Uncharacterized protein n=1 Tax=Ditylenchus dipsaci TaxID=166011 RepID=A0A915D0F5_9BILA
MISSSGEKSDGNPSGGSSNLSVSGGNSDGDSSGGGADKRWKSKASSDVYLLAMGGGSVGKPIEGNDDQIHCFKPDGPVPSGRFKLQQAREDKELAELIEEIDLEQQEENVENDSNVSLECY